MRGIVKAKSEIRKEGVKPFDVLNIDGKDYSCFNLTLSADVWPEDLVDYEFKPSGQYSNITKLEVVQKRGAKPTVSVQDQIVRMNALTNAVNWLNAHTSELVGVLEQAKEFERYIKGEE